MINWLVVNGEPVPTTLKEKIAIYFIAVTGFFTALIAMIFALAVVFGFLLLLASPFLLVGWIGWLVIG